MISAAGASAALSTTYVLASTSKVMAACPCKHCTAELLVMLAAEVKRLCRPCGRTCLQDVVVSNDVLLGA